MLESLPSRERGLKYFYIHNLARISIVAPFAGAWIEIENPRQFLAKMNKSLPSRERGLKSIACVACLAVYVSLPSRERGLKSQCSLRS